MGTSDRRLFARIAFMAAGGAALATIAAIVILGLWAFWLVLLVIGFVLAGLWLLRPAESPNE